MTAVKVWFDPQLQLIMIDGVAPRPPLTLTAAWDGYLIRVSEVTGRGVLALSLGQIADQGGMPFDDSDVALTYLEEVFTQQFKVDGGVV